jgi:hypothetical protein
MERVQRLRMDARSSRRGHRTVTVAKSALPIVGIRLQRAVGTRWQCRGHGYEQAHFFKAERNHLDDRVHAGWSGLGEQ